MMSMALPSLPNTSFRFRSRPFSLPGEQRIAWRVSLVVVVLTKSRAARSSLARIHLVCDALRTRERMERFEHVLKGDAAPVTWIPRIDPALGRAIDIGLGEQLLDRVKDKYQLTEVGKKLADQLIADDEILVDEKSFLKRNRALLSEGRLSSLLLRGGSHAS